MHRYTHTQTHTGRRGCKSADPWGVGGNSGGCEASGVDPEPTGVEWEEGGREASRVEENPRRGCHRVGGGGSIRLWTTRPATERAGGSSRPRTTQPPGEGEGQSSHVRMTRLQTQMEGDSSRHGITRIPERSGAPRESKPWDPPQHPDPNGGMTDMGGGEGTKTHPPSKPTASNRPLAETERRHGA